MKMINPTNKSQYWHVFVGFVLFCVYSCNGSNANPNNAELITDSSTQENIFRQLLSLTGDAIPKDKMKDSLAFLILPVEASCPSCRKKTIDSIVKHQENLISNHFLIITASGGRKTIRSYFLEQNKDLPNLEQALFLDTNNLANKYKLFKDNPVFYYSANGKAYKRIYAIPATVRDDLREFFSGYRINNHIAHKDD